MIVRLHAILVLALGVGLSLAPLGAQETSTASGDDVFGKDEQVTTTTEQTQNAAPRKELLKEAVPLLTGSFTGKVGFSWNWSDIYGAPFNLLSSTSRSLDQQGTELDLGFVARPDTDISITGEVRTNYPFVQQVTTGTAPTTSTITVPSFTVWSLYSKFTWNDALFLSFGKQSLKWGTGYFFSPADDVFAQSAVDLSNPTAEREGPLALKVQYPIPRTMDNLYFYAAFPVSSDPAALAALQPEDIAVAAKAEFLFGNTELAAAGFYQRSQRPQVILMGTTGTGSFDFFAEGLAAFPSGQSDAYVEKASSTVTWATGSSAYRVVDRSGSTFFKATGGLMYKNPDTNFTFVCQYLYNGQGYGSLSIQDILQAMMDRALGRPAGEPSFTTASVANTLTGLGQIGEHYGAISFSWTSIANTKTDFSVLVLSNLSDGSGYVNPTISYMMLTYVRLSLGASLSWGGTGTEYADPTGFASTFPTINGQPNPSYNPNYVARPTLAIMLGASIGTGSF